MQIIAVGDFFQLPPVVKSEDRRLGPASPPPPHVINGSGGDTPNRRSSGGGRTQSSGRSAAGSGSGLRCNASGSGSSSSAQKRKREDPEPDDLDSDDEGAPPKVPVIMAALPPGFVTWTAAETAQWSTQAQARLAAKAAAAATAAAAAAAASRGTGAGSAGDSSSSAAAAAAAVAAGYPIVAALAGSDFTDPLLQQQQQAVQQQQQCDVDMQGLPCKKQCRPGSNKQEQQPADDTVNADMYPQPMQQELQQQQRQVVDAASELLSQQSLPQPEAAAAAAPEDALALSPQARLLQSLTQRMTQRLDPQKLRALGIPAARMPAGQLPAAVQQMLASRKDLLGAQPLLRKSQDLGLQMLLLQEAGAAAAVVRDGAGHSSGLAPGAAAAAAAAVVKVEPGVQQQEDGMEEDGGGDDDDEWAAVLEAEATLQQQQQQQEQLAAAVGPADQQQQGYSSGNAAMGAAAVAAAAAVALPGDEGIYEEIMPTLQCGSPAAAAAAAAQLGSKCAGAVRASDSTSSDTAAAAAAAASGLGAACAADASQGTPGAAAAAAAAGSGGVSDRFGLLRLSLGGDNSGQPALLRPAPAAAAGDNTDWEIVDMLEPGEAARKDVVDLAAVGDESDDEVIVDVSSEECEQVDCKMQAGAAAAAAGLAVVTPAKIKLAQQQQQQRALGGHAAAAAADVVVTPVKPKLEQQQQYQVSAPPSALQLAAAATAAAAAAAAVPLSPAASPQRPKVLGRDVGYAESGGFPFWRIPAGDIYNRDNTISPALVHVSMPGTNGSSMGLGTAAGQQQQLPPGMSPLRPGLTSGSSSSSGSGGRPVLPAWREAAWAKSYCFKSAAWAAAGFTPVVLRQPFRQVCRMVGDGAVAWPWSAWLQCCMPSSESGGLADCCRGKQYASHLAISLHTVLHLLPCRTSRSCCRCWMRCGRASSPCRRGRSSAAYSGRCRLMTASSLQSCSPRISRWACSVVWTGVCVCVCYGML
jgi:hypothetical protein